MTNLKWNPLFANIPKELKALPQWVIATKSEIKEKNKLPINPHTGQAADSTRSQDWATFELAKSKLSEPQPHMGFVLSSEDPYTIIDLDDPYKSEKPWDDAKRESLAKLNAKIIDSFESYTEISQSGKGVHIIVKGSIPKGVNRDSVELYSSQRYMITTGNVFKKLPIVDCQELLTRLYEQMKPLSASVELEEVAMTTEDNGIIEMAMAAANGGKFVELCRSIPDGNQNSEMDLALLSIIAFYSESNEQCRRIFRNTNRGKRDKVVKNDKYLNYTLQKIRANAVPRVDFSELSANAAALMDSMKVAEHPPAEVDQTAALIKEYKQKIANSMAVPPELLGKPENNVANNAPKAKEESFKPAVGNIALALQANFNKTEPKPRRKLQTKEEPITNEEDIDLIPPGLVGEIAKYIYSAAAHPVREIALAGALGYFAGLVGRQYNVSTVGLNIYLILLADTGTGKESMASGISTLNKELCVSIIQAKDFIGPSSFASGPALVKTMARTSSIISIQGEFGITLQNLCDPRANSAQMTLRQAILDLYMKSGKNNVLNPSVYSDSEKNTELVECPALSILGESNPVTFYEGLSEQHISDGLIPRFIVIEYKGKRPYLNDEANIGHAPSDALMNKLVETVTTVFDLKLNQSHGNVVLAEDVKKESKKYGMAITDTMNASKSQTLKQLWSRADLKIKKLAGLVAVGVDHHNPVITMSIYNWARRFIERDVKNMLHRFEKGEVGQGESKQHADLMRILKKYFGNKPTKEHKKYHERGVIQRKYFSRNLLNLSSFKADSRGGAIALDRLLVTCCQDGDLVEIAAPQAKTEFDSTAKLYGLGSDFDLG